LLEHILTKTLEIFQKTAARKGVKGERNCCCYLKCGPPAGGPVISSPAVGGTVRPASRRGLKKHKKFSPVYLFKFVSCSISDPITPW